MLAVFLSPSLHSVPLVIGDSLSYIQQLIASDLDNDADVDILCRDLGTRVFLNDGSGRSFAEMLLYAPGVQNASIVTLGNLNGNGLPDIISCSGLGYDVVWHEFQTGSFVVVDTLFQLPTWARWMQCEDTDSDGVQDLWMRVDQPTRLYRATDTLNDGIPDSATLCLSGIHRYTKFHFAELNGDGVHDLLITRDSSHRPDIIHWGTPGGCFSGAPDTLCAEGSGCKPELILDVDFDGDQDLWMNPGGGMFTKLFLNDGAGNFPNEAETTIYPLATDEVYACNVNGDSLLDILLIQGSLSTAMCLVARDTFFDLPVELIRLAPLVNYRPVFTTASLEVAQGLSVVAWGQGDDRLTLATCTTNRVFRLDTVLASNMGQVYDLAVADADGDQGLDIVAVASDSQLPYCMPRIFLNGDSLFHSFTPDSICVQGWDLLPVLLEQGAPGLAYRNAGAMHFLERIGSDWTEVDSVALPDMEQAKLAADLDGDGDDDLLVAAGFPFPIYRLINEGAPGYFVQGPDLDAPTNSLASGLEFFDADQDGIGDIILITDIGWVYAYPGEGAGAYGPPELLWTSPDVDLADAADMNGDGLTDLVFFDLSSMNSFLIWAPQPTMPGAAWDTDYLFSFDPDDLTSSTRLLCADVDEDGMPDILHTIEGRVMVHWNEMEMGMVETSLENNRLKIWPNPCDAFCALSSSGEAPVEPVVYSMDGRHHAVPSTRTTSGTRLDTSQLPPGAYTVRVLTGNGGTAVGRLIKGIR